MKVINKLIAISLAIVICLGCLSVISFAAEDTIPHLTYVPDGYTAVYTKDDLDSIRLNMAGKYILMNDIEFTDSDFKSGGSFYNSGKGWDPIGTSSSFFKGIFDGNGYKISNLYIKDTTKDNIGLFGYVKKGTIKNVALINANITGKNYVGGIVGYSYYSSTVEYCDVQGSVTGTDYVGGIVGYQNPYHSTAKEYNYIKNCNNSAKINGARYVGGIAGYSCSEYYSSGSSYLYYGYSYVQYCSNRGQVTATGTSVGGIIGKSVCTNKLNQYIECCYNAGNIKGSNYAGGICGYNTSGYTYIKHCYSVGNVTAESNFGGCCGSTPHSSDKYNYYLNNSVVNPTCSYGTAKSKDQLIKKTAFEQWDFNTVWTMDGDADYSYPELINAPRFETDNSTAHQHSYTSKITKPATHTETGIKTYTCSCGDSYTETIDKIVGHNYYAIVTAPTCKTQGYTTYTCACGDTYTSNYINSSGHKEVTDPAVAPNCSSTGKTEGSHCSVCGEVINAQSILPTTSHTASDWIIEEQATCSVNGSKYKQCTTCGETLETQVIYATEHRASDWIIEEQATCSVNGSKYKQCTKCGETLETQVIYATEHSPSNWIIEEQATCSVNGSKYKQCTKCGETLETQVIYAKGHNEIKDSAIEATCTSAGKTEGSHCSICSEVIKTQTTIPAKGHTASNWIIDKEATCTTNGSKYKQCIDCGMVIETVTIYASGHIEVRDPAVTKTCTESGKTEGSHCIICDTVIKTQTIIPAEGHKPGNWITDKKATVDKAGSKHKECTECGETVETATLKQLICSKPKLTKIENTSSGVKISWEKVSGADKYRVYRKTKTGSWRYIGGTKSTSYTDKTAKSGLKYYYAVKARNEVGNSSLSSSLSKYYLDDPTLKTPSSNKTGITLEWNKITGSEGYIVYRKTGSGSYKKIATVTSYKKVKYIDKSAKKGKTYTYKIKAYKGKTYSVDSNSMKIKDKF